MARKPKVICRTKRLAAWDKKHALEIAEAQAWILFAIGVSSIPGATYQEVEHSVDKLLGMWRKRFAPLYEEST